jgi:hypothetical protein
MRSLQLHNTGRSQLPALLVARDKVEYGRYCIAIRVHGPGSVVKETGSWPVRRTGCGRKLSTAWVDTLFFSFRERTYSLYITHKSRDEGRF